jgi:hypothetical protein
VAGLGSQSPLRALTEEQRRLRAKDPPLRRFFFEFSTSWKILGFTPLRVFMRWLLVLAELRRDSSKKRYSLAPHSGVAAGRGEVSKFTPPRRGGAEARQDEQDFRILREAKLKPRRRREMLARGKAAKQTPPRVNRPPKIILPLRLEREEGRMRSRNSNRRDAEAQRRDRVLAHGPVMGRVGRVCSDF